MENERVLRILVVEDNQDAARCLAQLLEASGHEVVVASDGRSALGAVEAAPPDVALIDIGLPDVDGYQVAKILLARPAEKRPLLVAVTGHGQEDDFKRSLEAGIDLHLVKPADPEQLQQLLIRFQALLGGVEEPEPAAPGA
jgi:CheY-like chemotaxis protein